MGYKTMKLTDMTPKTISWFLEELGSSELEYFETGMLEIVVSDEEGNEGTTDVLVVELASAASLLIAEQEKELGKLRKIVSNSHQWDDITMRAIQKRFKHWGYNSNQITRSMYRTGNVKCIRHTISRCQVCTTDAYEEANVPR
jgi:hypothetical protein